MRIHIINGPNLNLLGTRQTEYYGTDTWDEILIGLKERFSGIELTAFQSNHEAQIIDELQRIDELVDAVVLNAGAYTHTSLAIADSIAALGTPVVEVHMSNVYQREEVRHHSMIAEHCIGSITGFGADSYALAILAFIKT
jgi:3-dehydroquinate dehydratase-2